MTQDNRLGHIPQTQEDRFAKLRDLLSEPVKTEIPKSEKSDKSPSVLFVSGDNNNIALHGLMQQTGAKMFKHHDFAVIIALILFFS